MATNKFFLLPLVVVLIVFQIASERPQLFSANDRSSAEQPQQQLDRLHDTPTNEPARDAHTHTSSRLQSPKEEKPLCSNEQIVDGEWTPITLDRPPYIPLSPRVRCLPNGAFSQPFPTWIWQPQREQNCRVVPWNPAAFCQLDLLSNNQTIAFIGDSLTLEHYASLIHMLGDRARLPPKAVKHGRIKRHICVSTTTINQNINAGANIEEHDKENENENCINVVFRTDFFLENTTQEIHYHQQQLDQDQEHESTNSESQLVPRVLVLNRGAHYTPDQELLESLQTKTLPDLLHWNNHHCHTSQSSHQKCQLIWRTTVPGHPHCQNFTKPSTSIPAMEAWIHDKSTNDPTVYRKGEYHWQDFQRQNALVKQLLLEQWQPQLTHVQIHILDAYSVNILRPDNHRSHMRDCLHSCSPGGGSDFNSQWLFHILLRQQQQELQSLVLS